MLKHCRLAQRIVSFLLVLTLVASFCTGIASAAENGTSSGSIALSGHIPDTITDSSGKNITIQNNTITVGLGTYSYSDKTGIAGSFIVDASTKKIEFAKVSWGNVWPLNETGTLTMSHQDGRVFTGTGKNKDTSFVVPVCGGDSYYNWTFTPENDQYMTQTGHIYVYRDETFARLNLSDSERIPYVKKNYATVKAPKGMEVMLTSQLKLYRARDYVKCEPVRSDDEYDYYTMHVPVETQSSQVFMLRQKDKDGNDVKVIRFGYADQVGTWNADKTELTLRELKSDPYQVNRNQAHVDANIMTNLPLNSQIELKSGEYFDLVPLRAWQAIANSGSNQYQDPPYNYFVIGDSVTVEVTEDDEVGQFGRIKAVKPGVSLVLFSYEAMESLVEEASLKDENGLLVYSALLPELTGVAVVKVGDNEETGITTNIDMVEGRTVYFVRTQTSETGVLENKETYATYTFTPKADGGSITSVRVHAPIMVENGKLPTGYSASTDWLKDKSWTTYTANADGSYSLHLAEGRNIVEVSSGAKTEYHVITARGLDVKLDNVYAPGNAFAVGDTVKVTLNRLLPAFYKQGAIYNPSGNPAKYNANGTEISVDFGAYTVSTNANFTFSLSDEDAGTFNLTNGGISTSYWGSSGQDMHRNLTRASMSSAWGGGDNPEIDLGVLAKLPDISFNVESDESYAETVSRQSGLLEAIAFSISKSKEITTASVSYGNTWGTDNIAVRRNYCIAKPLKNAKIYIGAKPLYDKNAKILVRSWNGTNVNDAKVEEIPIGELTFKPNAYYQKTDGYISVSKISNTTGTTTTSMEVICTPSTGDPTTYSEFLYIATTKPAPVLTDLSISAVNGTMGRFDGILEAPDVTYTDDAGQLQTLDLGYGFITTEYSYKTSVPYDVTAITFTATGAIGAKTITATLNESTESYNSGQKIPLTDGKNTLVVTATNNNGKTNYTIEIERAASPDYVTFEVPSGAKVTVKKSGKTQLAYAVNTSTGVFMYELPGGDYTYSVELAGYKTYTGTFTAPLKEKIIVKLEDMEALPNYSGSFKVSIHGQSDEVCSLTTRTIPETADNLMAKKYVTSNFGGYTVLHALIEACEDAGVSFKCSKGVLTPTVALDNSLTGAGCGWVCEVNGQTVDPYSTLVKPNDVIRFYYTNRSGITHAWFDIDTATATRGSSVTLTLMGAPVNNNGSNASAISGATILVDGKAVATTDYAGKAIISTDDLLLGSHIITATKPDGEVVNVLTYAQANLTLNKAVNSDADPDVTEVTFRLIGDTKHSTSNHAYTTWIATETYKFAASSVSVGDVFKLALECAGLESDDFSDNYVAWINAPESLGGYKLSEKDNGSNSGWQYTVNGVHPSYGLNDFDVTTGDEIIWHYVDNYATEETKYTWLAAEDVNPEGINPVVPKDPVEVDTDENPDEPDEPPVPGELVIPDVLKDIYPKTAATLLSKTPGTGVTNGEWMILGLARSSFDIPSSYENSYLTAVTQMLTSDMVDGKLPSSTDNMRVSLALSALGYDPTDFNNYDLVNALKDTTWVIKQGNNASAYALLTLDACEYGTDALRQTYITSLLGNQNTDKGWPISGTDGSDLDVTMMIITALAPYYETDRDVKTAIDDALTYAKAKQNADGSFGTSAETNAQVIVALSTLGTDCDSDAWSKNGQSVLDALVGYYTTNRGNGFYHDNAQKRYNQMATEQSFYAMVAYIRYLNKQPSLYDMSDAVKREDASAEEVIKLIDAIGPVNERSYNAIAKARIAYDNLSAEDRAKVTNYDKLTAAEAAYETILKQKRADQYKALKVHYDELLNDKTKKYGNAAKKKLQSILQTAQKDMNAAVSCEQVEVIFQNAKSDLDAVKPGDIEVTFRLIGALEATQDVNLTNDSYLPEYVTWVPTTTYALQENATVYDLFTEAMKDAGLRYVGADNNYISTIYAPSCLGGYALSEFSNGTRSGWMYTLNNIHTNYGLKEQELKDGDVVVWHYVNDYAHEVSDWNGGGQYPSLGNGTYYNGWLRAADIAPEQYVQQLLGKILTVGKHGTVEPKLTFQHIGKSVTFTFKPDTGYKVKDVKVNGKSVGAVKTYTIDKLTVSTRIEVEFTNGKLPFTDVRESDWFYEDVAFAYENGLFAGTSDTTFSPNASMTRAMLVTVLYRLEGQPTVNGRSGFSDVQYNGYYEDAVTWAADNGIVNGTSTTMFSPNANVTREQMAAILYRYAQYKKYNTAASSSLTGFSDHAAVSSYAVTPMQWAVAEKLINGSNGKLMPTGNATRAQVAAILHRFVENVAKTTK